MIDTLRRYAGKRFQALTTASHDPSPDRTIAQSFSGRDFRTHASDESIGLIVHHHAEEAPASSTFSELFRVEEFAAVFSSSKGPAKAVSADYCRSLLAGHTGQTALARDTGVVRHGELLNARALQHTMKIGEMAPGVVGRHPKDYFGLLKRGVENPEHLIFGLRGEYADPTMLQLVRVDDSTPSDRGQRRPYPFITAVGFYVRQRHSSAQLHSAHRFINITLKRITADRAWFEAR